MRSDAFVQPTDSGRRICCSARETRMPTPVRLPRLLVAAGLLVLLVPRPAPADPPPSDLDRLMARVLEQREQVWKRFHDYVLREHERVVMTGPGHVPLYGQDREYAWFVQDGYYVRSPIKADGVRLDEAERRRREAEWLEHERRREERARSKAADAAATPAEQVEAPPRAPAASPDVPDGTSDEVATLFKATVEPRFLSEAYFLKFRFEPGNYFLAGRESLEGRSVLRIEYYPTRLFAGDKGASENEARMARQMNKVALVTLWVDPEALQIVKYVFENVDFGFVPGRWLVRVDKVWASMTMGQPVNGVWLPVRIEAQVGMSLASGPFSFEYDRRFHDYRRAETSARVRAYRPMER